MNVIHKFRNAIKARHPRILLVLSSPLLHSIDSFVLVALANSVSFKELEFLILEAGIKATWVWSRL